MVQKSLIVAVRVRPLLEFELRNETAKNILRVIDRRMVVVLDPDESKVERFWSSLLNFES